MNMKTIKTWVLLVAGLLLTAGCANDDTANKDNEQEPGTEGLTSFVEENNATRTTAEYDNGGLNFYWTAGDRLWVNNGALTQDSKNNINSTLESHPTMPTTAVKRVAKAKFWFAGTFTASSYPVRYTGKNGASNKVTIKANQAQIVPNDASHIGEDGDCGVATATKPVGSEAYGFTLDHKAAYATFLPYNSNRVVADFVIQKITIMADQALCGTFDFNDNGIDVGSRPAPTAANKVVELTLNNFPIPATATPTTNAATAVIAPGSYTNFIVIYTLHNPITNQTGTVTKQYPGTVTFTEGKNKKISQNLPPDYSAAGYYMWDAAADKPYWYGHLDSNGIPDGNYPQTNTDSRWYREDASWPCPSANRSCKDCPNANECIWYAMQGDPHYDDGDELWTMMGHLYQCGMWFKKKDHILGFTASNYNGTDYRTTAPYFTNSDTNHGKPGNIKDYFYLPASGFYINGTLIDVDRGYYWSSTPSPTGTGNACALDFSFGDVNVSDNLRNNGFRLWKAQ